MIVSCPNRPPQGNMGASPYETPKIVEGDQPKIESLGPDLKHLRKETGKF